MPRIIAGEKKGLRLKSPQGKNTRPTTDRIKETIFNILSPYIENSTVLDVFAGTGSLGIEALSRGGKSATFIENNKGCSDIIKSNLEFTGYNNVSDVIYMSVAAAIKMLSQNNAKFDMIFMDPPYCKNFIASTLQNLIINGIISSEGIVVIERSVNEKLFSTDFPFEDYLILKREESFKETIISFLVMKPCGP